MWTMKRTFGLLSVASAAAFGAAPVALIVQSGCGTSATVTPTAGESDAGTSLPLDGSAGGALPCDVDAILAANCRQCHASSPQFGSPMPLVTLGDLRADAPSAPGRKVYELVTERIADDRRPMPEPPNRRLDVSERATLTAWVAAGAPAGAAVCAAKPIEPAKGVTCKPNLPIAPAAAWEMPASSGDEYACYGVELKPAAPTHVVGFAPRIDNASIVHHIVLFESDKAYSPTPIKCSAGGSLQWRMVSAWAPGGAGFELPPDVGFPLKTTGSTHYVVQMHYSNPQALPNQRDTSGFDLCTSTPRTYEADVLAFGTQELTIPPNRPTYASTCSITVPPQLAGLHLIASMPHMHKLGTSMTTELLSGGPAGAATDLGTTANFSFNTQAWLPITGASGVVTKANDVIRTRCAWNNATGDAVRFGEKTADEMCYSFTVYYPRVSAPLWSWAAPAAASTCRE